MIQRGRPKKDKRMVALIVMVPPEVKAYLQRCAEVQNVTLSQKTREILNHFWVTR